MNGIQRDAVHRAVTEYMASVADHREAVEAVMRDVVWSTKRRRVDELRDRLYRQAQALIDTLYEVDDAAGWDGEDER